MDDVDKLPSFDAAAIPRRLTSLLGGGGSGCAGFEKLYVVTPSQQI
jgi:hypothetical protein